MGTLREAGLVARKLGDFPLGIFGAPAYFARHPAPRTPAQLDDHACVTFIMPGTGRALPWQFGAGSRSFSPRASVRCSEDVLALVTLARAGLGLIQTYDFMVERELERGLLVEVLRDHRGASRPFSLVYPTTPKRSPAARTLLDFLLETRPSRTHPGETARGIGT
jgi:DNA-binding transcriptional LysR family regulator